MKYPLDKAFYQPGMSIKGITCGKKNNKTHMKYPLDKAFYQPGMSIKGITFDKNEKNKIHT